MKNLKIGKLSKIFLFLISLLLILNFSFAKEIEYISSELNLKTVDPIHPKAGDLLKITFELTNIGNKRGNFYVYFLNNSVFQYITQDEKVINVGIKETKDFNVYFKISNNVTSGNYPLVVKVISETGEERTFTFFINVKNEPNLVFKQKNIVCLINEKCDLNLSLLNNGYGKAKNIVINFNLPSKTVEFKELRALESKPLNTQIYIPENLDEGVYNLKASISYMDENNNLIKKQLNLPIELKSNVDLEVSSLLYNKEENYIKIKVENPGEGKAKEIVLNVELPNLNLKQTFFLGKLEEGEDSTVYFYLPEHLIIKDEEQPIKIDLQWKDYKKEKKEFKGNVLITKNFESTSKLGLISVVLLLIAVVAYFGIRKLTKKEKEE
jgi:uncharacterized membrane protein